MFKKQGGFAAVGISVILVAALWGAILYGWINNIVSLVQAEHIAGLEIARVAGIFVAPLGVVLGYF